MAYHQVEMFREDVSKPSGLSAALSVGWGIGASMALILQAPGLFSALGPADLPAQGCPSVSAFHIQALITLPLALTHILITIVLFDAYQRKSWFLIVLATSLHLVASFAVRFKFKILVQKTQKSQNLDFFTILFLFLKGHLFASLYCWKMV